MVSTSAVRLALPLASDFRLGRSPAWRSALPWAPCGLPNGLKCPLALMPSPELQSPASWTWKPNSPFGRRPLTLAATRTLSPRCSKLTVPRTVLPLVGWRLAVAFGPPPHMLCIVSQPASATAARPTEEGHPHFCAVLLGRHRARPWSSCSWRPPCPAPSEVGGVLRLAAAAFSASAVFSASVFAGGGGSLAWDAATAPIRRPRQQCDDCLFHDLSFMCAAAGPAGTAPPAACGRLPDFTSLYQISWCSFAHTSST